MSTIGHCEKESSRSVHAIEFAYSPIVHVPCTSTNVVSGIDSPSVMPDVFIGTVTRPSLSNRKEPARCLPIVDAVTVD